MPDVTTAELSTLAGPLVLRLQEADDAGDVRTQVVRITARRCAIGSDSTCNLQIRTGASPLDCLIVRGQERTVVRRWTTDTLLSGGEPSDAVLVPGDRFEVGRAEFEVLEVDALAGDLSEDHVVEIADEPAASLREVALQNWQSTARLRRGCTLNRQRARRLAEQLRACRAELAALKQSLAEGDRAWENHSPAAIESEVEPLEGRATPPAGDEDEVASEDLRFEAISTDAPVTASALLGRLGVTLPEDDQAEDGPPTIAAAAAPTVAERSAFSAVERQQHEVRHSPANSEVRDEEESVEDYMSRLLERVRQKADSPQTSYQPVAVPRAIEKPAQEPVAVVDDKPAPLTELPARRGRPDEAVDLSAMRELAHLHAQSVLDTHFRRRFQRSSIGQMGVVAGSLLLGVVLAGVASHWPLAIYPAMLSFAVAIVWGAQYALSMRQIAAMREGQAGNESPAAATQPTATRMADDKALQ